MTASQPSPCWLFSWSTVNPTTHDRDAVTSALNVLYASQSCDTPSVAAAGHCPPENVSFRLCVPAVAWSADCSIFTGGSLSAAAGGTDWDQALIPAGSSKSNRTF